MVRFVLALLVLASLSTGGCGEAPPTKPRIVTEAVAYNHDGVELEGYLAYDATLSRRRPGVLVVHEWWGLQDHPKERARRLAALGYVAFCLDMYGKGKVSDDVEQAQAWSGAFYTDRAGHGRARAKAGLAVLAKDSRVDPARIAAIGFCYGGSVALELAYANAGLKAVACFHGSLLLPEEPKDAAIPTVILVLNGADDAWVGPDAVAAWREAMDERGVTYGFQSFPGAVHAFTNPGADARGMDNVAYNKGADDKSWSALDGFLRLHLGR